MLVVVVTGNVARDPMVSEVSGNQVCNFTVLSNGKKGTEEIVSAVDVAVWGKRAEVAAKYIRKGSLVTVSGTGHVETYEGKSGPGSKITLNASDFTLPPKPKTEEDAF
jgi:single-stranded DNA-binding protein